ncbi:MAG: ABC transporter ATP-binding protein [Bdellovibrionales bacterium]
MKLMWQVLWPELKPYGRRLAVVFAFGILVSALKAYTPELLGQLPKAWEAKDTDASLRIPILIAALWIAAAAARYYHIFWMRYISDMIAVNLRRQLMDKYLTLNLSFFSSFVRGSGGLISRMLNDIVLIQGGLHRTADIVREPFMVLFAFGYLVYLDWRLTLFILVAAPIIITVTRRFVKSLRKYSHQNQETMEDLTQVLKESLDGTRIVQSFNLENEMRRRFNVIAENYLRSARKIISREEASGPSSEALASLFIAVVLVYIGHRMIRAELALGDFMSFAFAIGLLQDSLKKVQAGFMRLQQASVALERMRSILENDSIVPQVTNPVPFPKNWSEIEFRNLTFGFNDQPVLRNVNLTVQRGEVVALVGASGSGKTTLTNLTARFFDPTEGEICIGGVPIRQMDLTELRHNIALVAQDVFLFSDTIEKNIWAGDFSKPVSGVEPAAKLANAHSFIMRTPEGYQNRVGDRGSLLSGGEKQRLSIARAIFKDAPILILDEATSALDSESELEVQKGLDHLLQGRTALVIAHRLSTIAKADRILVLSKGQIIEQGNHQQLLDQKGEYYRFFQLQAGL